MSEENNKIFNIGCLGAARIAKQALIYPSKKLDNVVLYGIAARDKAKAEKFAKKHKFTKVYESYVDLITSDEIDIVFNPLPNGYHAYYSILALQNGKHVLCEKPLASNQDEVDLIIKAQQEAPLNPKTNTKPIIIEAFHYRHHPLSLKLREKVLNGDLGDIKSVDVMFSIPGFFVPKTDIRFDAKGKNRELAGGSLMDLGCYAVSFLRMFAETHLTQGYEERTDFKVTEAEIKEAFKDIKGVDQSASATVEFFNSEEDEEEKKVIGKIKTNLKGYGVSIKYTVLGTKKKLFVFNPVAPQYYHYVTETDLKTKTKQSWKEYGPKENRGSTYYYQLKHFIAALNGDDKALEICEWAGSLSKSKHNQAILDEIYLKAGSEVRQGKSCETLFKVDAKQEKEVEE